MRFRNSCGGAVLLGLLPLAACTSTGIVQTATTEAPAPVVTVTRPDAGDRAAIEALYWARQDSARAAFTEADVAFMSGMIGHHAQALIMSRLAPTNGASPAVQTLAARIINAQQDEIASMQRWLRERGQPVPEVHIDGLTLMIHGGDAHAHDHAHMPGMLTDEQLRELSEARGEAFDRLFLTYMIQHHSGAITMVDELFATDGAALDDAAFKLASEIHVDQITEIARMKRMLGNVPAGTSAQPPAQHHNH